MIRQLDLPALTLPNPVHNSLEIEYTSSIINYTAWALADDTLTQLNNNILAEIMTNSQQRYQESDKYQEFAVQVIVSVMLSSASCE